MHTADTGLVTKEDAWKEERITRLPLRGTPEVFCSTPGEEVLPRTHLLVKVAEVTRY